MKTQPEASAQEPPRDTLTFDLLIHALCSGITEEPGGLKGVWFSQSSECRRDPAGIREEEGGRRRSSRSGLALAACVHACVLFIFLEGFSILPCSEEIT